LEEPIISLRWPRPPEALMKEVGVCEHPDHERPELLPLFQGEGGLPVAVCPRHGPVAGYKEIVDCYLRTPKSMEGKYVFTEDCIQRTVKFGKTITIEKALKEGYTIQYLVARGIISPGEAAEIKKYYRDLEEAHRRMEEALRGLLRRGWKIRIARFSDGFDDLILKASSPKGEEVSVYYSRYDETYGEGHSPYLEFFITLTALMATSQRPVYVKVREELKRLLPKMEELQQEYNTLRFEAYNLKTLIEQPCEIARINGHLCITTRRGRRGTVGFTPDGRFSIFKTRPPRPGTKIVATGYEEGEDHRGREIIIVHRWQRLDEYIASKKPELLLQLSRLRQQQRQIEQEISELQEETHNIISKIFSSNNISVGWEEWEETYGRGPPFSPLREGGLTYKRSTTT